MWLKNLIAITILLGISACGDNNSHENTTEELTLKVDQIFQGEIPEEYQTCDNQEMIDKYGKFTVYLRLPEVISLREPLLIDIYGCWIVGTLVGGDSIYNGVEVLQQDETSVHIRLKKIDNTNGDVPTENEQFGKWDTYAVNGNWSNEDMELKVIVHNPDDELNATVLL